MRSSRQSSLSGSVLLITVSFVLIMALLAGSTLELARNTYKLAARNEFRARAQAVAESELEYMFFCFKSLCLEGALAKDVGAQLQSLGIADNTFTPTTVRDTFLDVHRTEGWQVRRSLITDRETMNGTLPNSTKTGNYTYINARVEVIAPAGSRFRESVRARYGRRFINSTATIFQYGVFYQGDLELTPGGDTAIDGDVVANGHIYMGVRSGFTLMLQGKVRQLLGKRFNTRPDGSTIYYNPNAPTPPVAIVAPSWTTSQASQLETIPEPENLLGGLDAVATAKKNPKLFAADGADPDDPEGWDTDQLDQAVNNVYRSIIVPPPSKSTGLEYPHATTGTSSATSDDPAISASRAYNRAGIIVDVDATTGAFTVTKVDPTTKATTAVTDPALLAVMNNVTMVDKREDATVKITEIDIDALRTKLESTPSLASDFNGLIYVNLEGASTTTPAAIRLVNAETLPNIGNKGFSVATNGGIYVKGNYNTKLSTGSSGKVSAMLMGDSLTVLSNAWKDENATATLASSPGSPSLRTADTHAEGDPAPVDDPSTTKYDESLVTIINSGLLTGTMASSPTIGSGGVQNLIRYLERWSDGSSTTPHMRYVYFDGSVGRLFASRHFDSPYVGAGITNEVYTNPSRTFRFDQRLAESPPPGSPTTTAYSRGDFFTW